VLQNVMRYTNSLQISARDRLSLLQDPSFSGSASNVFGALLNGASLFPYELDVHGLRSISAWLQREEISIYHSVPSLFRVASRTDKRFSQLRLVRLEGDQASRGDVELFKRCCSPGARLVNGLGATECGLVRQYFVEHAQPIPKGVLPVGYPVRDMEVLILDEMGRERDKNEIGEIAVRSRFLASGYWLEPERTRARFVPQESDPDLRLYLTGDLGRMREDGCLELLGRKTGQPRIGGRFVDLAAIEARLLELPGLSEVAVDCVPDLHGELRLVAYSVTDGSRLPPVARLRQHLLGAGLPAFMVPTSYLYLDRLPISRHGKLDRSALPPPDLKRPETGSHFEPPRSELERRLAAIWGGVLGVQPVGVHDNFFDLGAQSLSAARLIAEIERDFEHRLPLTALLEHATIRSQAGYLEGRPELDDLPKRWGSIVTLQHGGNETPLFCSPGASGSPIDLRRLAVALGSGRDCYAYTFRARDDLAPEEATLEEIAADFVDQVQGIQASGPYALCGYSWGGILAFEAARQLVALGQEVRFLGIVDEAAPLQKNLPARGLAYAKRLGRLDWRERFGSIWRFLARSVQRADADTFFPSRPEPRNAESWLQWEWNRAQKIAYITERRYQPGLYPGPLTLFAGPDDGSTAREPDFGWSALVSGRVAVIRIDGPHDDLLDELHVDALAYEIHGALQRTQQ
jgi:thioesterase domain-containing protein/acyl carrier protein